MKEDIENKQYKDLLDFITGKELDEDIVHPYLPEQYDYMKVDVVKCEAINIETGDTVDLVSLGYGDATLYF